MNDDESRALIAWNEAAAYAEQRPLDDEAWLRADRLWSAYKRANRQHERAEAAERRVQELEDRIERIIGGQKVYAEERNQAVTHGRQMRCQRDDALTLLQGWLVHTPSEAVGLGSLEDKTTDLLRACGRLQRGDGQGRRASAGGVSAC